MGKVFARFSRHIRLITLIGGPSDEFSCTEQVARELQQMELLEQHRELCGEHEHEHEHHHHDYDEHCDCGHEHHHHDHGHHHADEVFASWGKDTAQIYTEEQIKNILSEFDISEEYGIILRAKGIVRSIDGKWLHFDYIPGEADVRFGIADITGRLCVIGSKLDCEKIEKLFD